MKSIYCLIALFSGVFYWINCLKRKRGRVYYKECHVLSYYFLSRVILLSQYLDISRGIVFNFFVDLIVLYVIKRVLNWALENKDSSSYIMLYLTNPLVLVCMISKNPLRMIFLVSIIVLFFGVAIRKRIPINLVTFKLLKVHYFLFAIGGYLYCFSKDVLDLDWSMCKSESETYPILLVASALLICVAALNLVTMLYKKIEPTTLVSNDKCSKSEKETVYILKEFKDLLNQFAIIYDGEMPKEEVESNGRVLQSESMTLVSPKPVFRKRDWILLVIVTLISAGAIFYRIGSFTAPESVYEFQSEVNGRSELVLDLGEYRTVSKVSIYLGYKSNRKVALSSWNGTTQQWEEINNEINLPDVFRWNDIDVNRDTTHLGLVVLDDYVSIHEIVILDEEGNQIVPVNAQRYTELFDEQDKYPEEATYYYRTMFDEVYHARTAYETLHGLDIYEISHPPLGKNLMSIGIALFGMTPFGWRFIVALCGVMLTPLIYAFAWKITKQTKYAIAAAIILNADFMHFTLSRIATIDSIVAFFILLSFYLMYCFLEKEKEYCNMIRLQQAGAKQCQKVEIRLILLCGFAIGCAIATKWTGVYAALGLAVLLFTYLLMEYPTIKKQREAFQHLKILFWTFVIGFIAFPIVIYLLSYIPYTKVWDENLVEVAINNSITMLKYHEGVTTAHPYASEWYEWAWIKTPVFDSVNRYENDTASYVATFGNPIIWWGGIVSLLHNFYLWQIKRNRNAQYLCISYVSMLLPWIFVHRVVFIYQYYVCSIILVLLLVNSFLHMKSKKNRKLIIYVLLSVVVFIMFYPVISGKTVSYTYVKGVLQWLSTWTFMN